ncbi:MAG: undecaprenyl-diphosphate phosphatase [Thermoplasmata archaeon]
MTPLHAIILGLVQGLTEWLPVSSSGHLVLLQEFLGLDVPIFFDLMLHLATVIVVTFVFRGDILGIFRSLKRTFRLKREGMNLKDILKSERPSLLAWFVVLGSIPTAILGFVLYDLIKSLFSNLLVIGIALLATGTILALTIPSRKKKEFMTTYDALSIGLAQGISLVPGLSRSGLTISLGMLRGIDRELAARYSFLLSIPAILGAGTFELLEVMGNPPPIDPFLLAVAFLSSLIFGYLSIKALWFIIKRAKLYYFSAYCFLIGSIVLSYALLA